MKADNYYREDRDFDNMLFKAVKYCSDNDLKITKELGSGNFGIAFELEDGSALKITKDPCETYNAIKMKNSVMSFQNAVNIESVDVEGDFAFIKQELIDTDFMTIDEFQSIESRLLNADQEFMSFDENCLSEYPDISFTDNEIVFIKSISNGIDEIFDIGGFAYDLDQTNIGKRGDTYVLFDQKDLHSDPEDYVLKVHKEIGEITQKTEKEKTLRKNKLNRP